MNKMLFLVFANTDRTEGLARAVNALLMAREFDEAGDKASVIFYGTGVKWVAELERSDHPYHAVWLSHKDLVDGVCAECAEAFGAVDAARDAQLPLLADHNNHPSIRSYANAGYQIITI
jgi:hypothetical protein